MANLKKKDKKLKDNPKWKNLGHDKNNTNCLHCKCQIQEDSIPTEEFEVTVLQTDGTKKQQIIKEIEIIRGSLDECVGWTF